MCSHSVLPGLGDPSDSDLALLTLYCESFFPSLALCIVTYFCFGSKVPLAWPDFTTPNFSCRKAFPGYLIVVGFLAGKINRLIKYGKPLEPCLPLGQGEVFVDLLAPTRDRISGFLFFFFLTGTVVLIFI